MATRTTEGEPAPEPEPDSPLVDVAIPSMGESVSEGTLREWLVRVGHTVAPEQGVAEISTDKIDAELPSPVGGVVEEILAELDDTVKVGQVIARIREVKGAQARAAPPTP